MAENQPIARVTVFGGSGFLGREIVHRLAAEGLQVRIAVRNPDAVDRPGEGANLVEAVQADIRDESSVAQALEGAQAAVNAVGLYVESGTERFEAVHERGASILARQASLLGLARLVLISGIGADLTSPSAYVRARARGEQLTREGFARATTLRPSVLFGPTDNFINSLAAIARRTPVLPLFGRGDTRLQPVYVGDVAAATLQALQHPAAAGRTYELGGPQTYSYRALIELVLRQSQRRCRLLPLPFAVWRGLAVLASALPRPPITTAQVALMKQDNVVGDECLSLADLGVEATALEAVLPSYDFGTDET